MKICSNELVMGRMLCTQEQADIDLVLIGQMQSYEVNNNNIL